MNEPLSIEKVSGGEDLESADETAVLRLFQQYNHAIDRGEAELWASLWTENGIFEHPARAYVGRSELVQFVRDRATAGQAASVGDLEHWNTDIDLQFDGAVVHGTCRLLVAGVDRASREAVVAATGRYTDLIVREDDVWKFRRRSLKLG